MKILSEKRTRLVLLAAFALVLSGASPGGRGAVKVEQLRHWSNPNYTRVVIDLSSRAEYKHHLLKKDPSINKPRRLYVDVTGARLGGELKRNIPVGDGLLKTIRAGQYKKDTVRIVLDLETIKDYKVFPLTSPYRIVIDVFGKASSVNEPRSSGRAAPAKPFKIRTIVIDPGHGGRDPGAIGKRGLKEKDVTLKLSKMLKKELSRRLKARVILTRARDVYLRLDERTAIANVKEADLFVSIHANASRNRKATGIETYFLGSAKDSKATKLAARENYASVEDMDSVLQFILNDLSRSGNQIESVSLADSVQKRLSKRLSGRYRGIRSNGIKGAPFYVLVRTNMPSILVEVSFISNPRDEKRLRDNRYLKDIVSGIASGIIAHAGGHGSTQATR